MVGQGPAVLAAGAGWVGYVLFVCFFKSRLSYLPFLMPHLLGDGWTLKYCGLGRSNPAVVVSYYRRRAR